jgi:dUTP pyrophosphatase
MKLRIKLEPGAKAPHRSTEGAAAWDLFTDIGEAFVLYPNEMVALATGVSVELPPGYFWDVRIRSGLSTKNGIMLLNGAAVIDEDYRGVVRIPVINKGGIPYRFEHGEKIGQAILQKYETQEFEIVDELGETARGTGGFGHTGR